MFVYQLSAAVDTDCSDCRRWHGSPLSVEGIARSCLAERRGFDEDEIALSSIIDSERTEGASQVRAGSEPIAHPVY